jgi:hypothetical protein
MAVVQTKRWLLFKPKDGCCSNLKKAVVQT